MTSGPDIDAVLELTRDKVDAEIRAVLDEVSTDDFTIRELLALATLLRPAYERHLARLEHPPTPMKLVRKERRKKG